MNNLTERFVYDYASGAKDKALGRKLALEHVEDDGEVVRIEDVPWKAAHLETNPDLRKYCFTRRYHFENGYVFEIKGRRACHPRLEPLQINPLVLSPKAA